MNTCKKHPNRKAPYHCAKYDVHMCKECLHCKDPMIYCKHRQGCPIYLITHKKFDPDD